MTWISLCAAVFMEGIAIWSAAPWYVHAAVLLPGLMFGWMVWANPVSGLTLKGGTLTLAPKGRAERFALADIDHIHIRCGMDDDNAWIKLRSGQTHAISPQDLPPAEEFIDALLAASVAVRET